MKSAYQISDISDMKNRIGQFLSELAAPLFCQAERGILISKFHDIAEDCFRSSDPGHWKSELCVGGIPLEFALAIDDSASAGLRYYIDPHCGATSLDEAADSLNHTTPPFAPPTQLASDLIMRLSSKHFIDTERSPKTYFIHGLRFSPGHECVYRIYFNTTWRKRDDVYDILKEFLSHDDLTALASPSIAALPLFGVGYDIPEAGLDKIKLYLLVDTGRHDRVAAIARDLLGNRAAKLEALVRMALNRMAIDWRTPRMLVTIGFMPQRSDREVKFSLPCLMWEWSTFRILEPIVNRILDKWRFPEPIKSQSERASEDLPLWRFMPTHLSLGVSLARESMSVYFHPARPTEIRSPLRIDCSPTPGVHHFPDSPTGTLADRAHIFRAMFDTLLRAEA